MRQFLITDLHILNVELCCHSTISPQTPITSISGLSTTYSGACTQPSVCVQAPEHVTGSKDTRAYVRFVLNHLCGKSLGDKLQKMLGCRSAIMLTPAWKIGVKRRLLIAVSANGLAIGIAIPDHFRNTGISGLKTLNPGIGISINCRHYAAIYKPGVSKIGIGL
jgi:hypothetical protein